MGDVLYVDAGRVIEAWDLAGQRRWELRVVTKITSMFPADDRIYFSSGTHDTVQAVGVR